MLHKVLKITGSERTFNREDYTTPALFAGDYGNYLGTNLIVSSQTLIFENALFSLLDEYF